MEVRIIGIDQIGVIGLKVKVSDTGGQPNCCDTKENIFFEIHVDSN